VRYADDFLVFTKSEAASKRVYESIGNYLTRKLKLAVNHQKSRTCGTDGVDFLGFIFRGYGGQIRVSPKKIKKFKDRVREITRRNRGVSMRTRLVELRRYLQGWVGYFRLVPLKSFYEDLDKWIRRRLRACFWRQWRHPRTRVRNLLKLGVPEHEAFTHGSSSKGPWVMSSSKAVHMALSLDYLKQLGVVSLLDIWTKLAPKRRTARHSSKMGRTRMLGGVAGAPEQSGPLCRWIVRPIYMTTRMQQFATVDSTNVFGINGYAGNSRAVAINKLNFICGTV